MSLRKHLTTATVAAVALTFAVTAPLVTSATTSSASAAAPPATGCAQVTLIGVRGSLETAGTGNSGTVWTNGGLGPEAQGIASYVTANTGKTVNIVGLNYPALLPQSLTDWLRTLVSALFSFSVNGGQAPGTVYGDSKQAGVTALRTELNTLASSCPKTETALIGYSQGAHVIGDVIDNDAISQLTPTALNNIKAVSLEGDPSYRAGEPWDATSVSGNGIFTRTAGAFSTFNGSASGASGRVQSWCTAGDFFCQTTWGNIFNYSASLNTHTTGYQNAATYYTPIGSWIVTKL